MKPKKIASPPVAQIEQSVRIAIAEDLGDGDWTARLVDPGSHSTAMVFAREAAVICGRPWVDEVFRQFDESIKVQWQVEEGERARENQHLFQVSGPSRSLLGAERSALNFLQLLSGTATETARYVEEVVGTGARIVDTRKTVPGLRLAQKYAVRAGGGQNHRIGLYDGILIKENHVAAAGNLTVAIEKARALGAAVPLMAETESLDQVREALLADVEVLLVDNFNIAQIREAVELTRQHRESGGKTEIEYSGGATLDSVRQLAECGVDRISVGSLTKHVRAIDLSMLFDKVKG